LSTGSARGERCWQTSSAFIGAGWLLVALAGGPPVVMIGVMVLGALLFGIANTVFNITLSSFQQRTTPDHLLGRVRSCMLVLSLGAAPLGAVAGGILGQRFGLHIALLVGGIGISLGFVWVLLSPARTLRTEQR
jgi:predicted MFS family arabinose efflux permease